MNKPNVLIIADKNDAGILDTGVQSKNWNIYWQIISYNQLHKRVNEIREATKENNTDFVLYSRNDQVANRIAIGPITRKLRIGYSSFSGIDEQHRIEQMKTCFEDFMKCSKHSSFNIEKTQETTIQDNASSGTFSLIFDTEQLGCARYGLPRILAILKRHNIKATFFVTNLIKKIYPATFEEIRLQKHEIGIHGRWHEYLSNFGHKEQEELINQMKEDFDHEVHGANFIGRMNEGTVSALINNRIEYFVYPLINYFKLSSYPKLPTNPFLARNPEGNIWIFPISVETYNLPWFSIKNMVDSAVLCAQKNLFKHISILLHPFRDGNVQHMGTTQKLVKYLIFKKNLHAITLKQLTDSILGDKIHFKIIETSKFETTLKSGFEKKPLHSKTKQDFRGFFPENVLLVYKLVKRMHGVF